VADLDPALLATLSDTEIAHTLRMNVADFADVAQTIAQNPRATIEPAARASADALGRRALEDLGAAREERGIASGLDMERTIGEGGMGIVRLATQRSLGRKVAVKTLRPESRNEMATIRLLREAWVTGTLEHPNIVPVYDLGLGEDGSPVIILKRIEGVEWGEIIRDANAARERYGAHDLLEYNLRILVQLCNAVSLAHARGVLHRDLKPENVMIGSFGEVYLVDWGIAVSLKADALGRLPVAAEQNEMAGTPCYMAPEMLGALGKLSERTDVYLLGAILHEILSGAPPHTGTFKQIVGSILMSTFTYGATVPRELAEIARRAMSREPDARFASAEQLRLRLEWYLGHRGSLAISAEASRRLTDMRGLVTSGAPPESVHDQLYHLFAECRFGFRQALNASTDNQTARLGLREAIEIIVRFELQRGAAEAAAGALAELDDPPPELVASVGAALRARADEKQKMDRLELLDAQLDPTTGRRTRVAITAVLAIFWIVVPQITGAMVTRYPDFPDWGMYTWTSVVCAIGTFAVVWGWESMMRTAINRRIVAAGAVMFATQLTLEVGCHLLELPKVSASVIHMTVWAGAVGSLAMIIDRRFWFTFAAYLGAFLAACAYPQRRWDLMSASNFVLLLTFLIMWWQPIEDRPRFLKQ
jgi:eukaryotic-like serine/threonine-protein kinase